MAGTSGGSRTRGTHLPRWRIETRCCWTHAWKDRTEAVWNVHCPNPVVHCSFIHWQNFLLSLVSSSSALVAGKPSILIFVKSCCHWCLVKVKVSATSNTDLRLYWSSANRNQNSRPPLPFLLRHCSAHTQHYSVFRECFPYHMKNIYSRQNTSSSTMTTNQPEHRHSHLFFRIDLRVIGSSCSELFSPFWSIYDVFSQKQANRNMRI